MPTGDRFEWFCETVSSELMPVTLSTKHATDFAAEISDLALGPVRVSRFDFTPVWSRRTAAHVRRGDPEQYQLAWVTAGAFRISQCGKESVVSKDLVLTNTSRPMENCGVSDDGRVQAVVLQIPRAAMPLRSGRLDRLLAQRIPAGRGTAAVLTDFLSTLLDHGPQCGPEELHRMGTITLDLAAACLAQQAGAMTEAPAEARAQMMLQRITAFIEHNLSDPDLTPQAVADRHNISLRTLYGLFREQPFTVAASIRRRRLERCRADLTNRDLSSQPVQAIAARWGFSSASAFTRAFRDAYGITPTEHRTNEIHRDAGNVEKSCTVRTPPRVAQP
ncbi:helix-turn-helix domain-containing protein [Streptomyces flavidovirens]|uniref:AraC-like ligand-binding domain-containing protein n=1 Tax=Streptomyces flavidovirens TaxID=67298 RepID=UPI001FCB3532|nr:helix-turn-helix domain-containing protein [Streptomyces flavidovirens]